MSTEAKRKRSRLRRARQRILSLRKRARYTIRAAKKRKRHLGPSKYAHYCNTRKIQGNLVCYESYYGAGMICNPYAIFQRLLEDPTHRHLEHVWIIADEAEVIHLTNKYSEYKNVRFVHRSSNEYYLTLATAKYLIQNVSFPQFFAKRDTQVYIHTWHSITVKTLGFDQPNGNFETRNLLRNFLMSDYICSPNRFMTSIFRNSFKLDGLYPGKIIQTGHPRNDLTIRTPRDKVIRELKRRGIDIDPSKKIVLYAPTWRGSSVGNARSDAAEFEDFTARLVQQINSSEYQILIKPHHLTYNAMSEEERLRLPYIPRTVDTNELLGIVDILVSDYSSIYFDFMVSNKPILFYMPDLDKYTEERGLYFSPQELPGPVTTSVDQIGQWICNISQVFDSISLKYSETKNWACEFDDGEAASRVIAAIFDGDAPEVGQVISSLQDVERRRILFYVSDLGPNGVTAAFRALLDELQKGPYDITVAGHYGKTTTGHENWRDLGQGQSNVRPAIYYGTMALTDREVFGIEYVRRYGFNSRFAMRVLRPQQALKREFTRWFGNAHFDHIIDFSGYGAIWPLVLGQQKGAQKLIWQHNELAADLANRRKRGLKRYQSNPVSATGLRSVYEVYDHVVACGEEVMHLNRDALATRSTWAKFTHVDNLIDIPRIQKLIAAETLPGSSVEWLVVRDELDAGGCNKIMRLPFSEPAPESGEPYYKFVTIGRLAPEKNHSMLISAFASFSTRHPNSRLFIIGSGDLWTSLTHQIKSLGLADRVVLTGQQSNPFSIVKECDCFVLPSLYEGNVMVVPEIRVLGIPVIMTNFGSVGSACIDGGQLICEASVEGLDEAFESFYDGKVPQHYVFDFEDKNQRSLDSLKSLLDKAPILMSTDRPLSA